MSYDPSGGPPKRAGGMMQMGGNLPGYLFNKPKINVTGTRPSNIAPMAGVRGAKPEGGTLSAVEIGTMIFYYHEGSDDPSIDPRKKAGAKVLYGEEYYRQNPR